MKKGYFCKKYRGARFYDSDAGRFLSTDPLAAKYVAWGTYVYCLGNPVKYVDDTGKGPEGYITDKQGNVYYSPTIFGQGQINTMYGPNSELTYQGSDYVQERTDGNTIYYPPNNKAPSVMLNEVTISGKSPLSKVVSGTGGAVFGILGTITAGLYIGSTDGAGAALGGATAMTFCIGETVICSGQAVDGVKEMYGGESNESIHNVGSLPGVVAKGMGYENYEAVDALGQFAPGVLTGGSVKNWWGIISGAKDYLDSKTAGEVIFNGANLYDAHEDAKGVGLAPEF